MLSLPMKRSKKPRPAGNGAGKAASARVVNRYAVRPRYVRTTEWGDGHFSPPKTIAHFRDEAERMDYISTVLVRMGTQVFQRQWEPSLRQYVSWSGNVPEAQDALFDLKRSIQEARGHYECAAQAINARRRFIGAQLAALGDARE